jgi:orotate phosphoribosyltransferase
MRPSEVIRLFQACGAWLEGHFVLSSGLHSREYLQCAAVQQYPTLIGRLCQSLAERFASDEVTCVASPALGGIVVGYEVARHLGCRAIFAEREDGVLRFRRGFHVGPKDRVLVVEDVVTTGGSVEELMGLIRESGATIVGVAALVDRSGGWASFDVRYHTLISVDLKTFSPEACPLCKEGIPAVKPGSRSL